MSAKGPCFRRSLRAMREQARPGEPLELEAVKDHFVGFVYKLQKRYPWRFAKAYRGLKDEKNRWVQERLATYFLIGAVGELARLDQGMNGKVWDLAKLLSWTLGKGGENFHPKKFSPAEKALALELGEKTFSTLIKKEEDLSLQIKFKIGPVNQAEHCMAWCFRYARQLLQAAKWESVQGHDD